ncbi:MAG: tRNA (N6-isopentenyl adenosine(37)-C2)-methylthiotransferase MiaB [Erysipelotrichaceae bacterium]
MKMNKNWVLPSLLDAKLRRNKEITYDEYIFDPKFNDLGKDKNYYIRSYGCQANERDKETIMGILEQLGFTSVSSEEKADVIILNTCAVRKTAEDKVFGEIGALKQLKINNPNLVIGVCGCMSQEDDVVNKLLTTYRQVDLIFGTHNIDRLPYLLYDVMTTGHRQVEVYSDKAEVVENLPVKRIGSHKAWINIMYGCDKFCTYCIVPYTRGMQRSRKLEDILNEVKQCINDGFSEVTLLGQNVNAYGKDLDEGFRFNHLLTEVAKLPIKRLRFVTSHPWDFDDEMVDVLDKYPNIMPYIHLPVQSGDNDILKLMGRRYTIEKYKDLFNKIKEKLPNCAFTTDIIVGFPNESDEQFQHTLDIVDYCKYDNVYCFIYSPREKTPASLMEDNVPMDVKKKRLDMLNERFRVYALENNLAYVGNIEEVLVDGLSKRNDNIYSGYTKSNKLVNFKSDIVLNTGDYVDVKITSAKTFTLDGEKI